MAVSPTDDLQVTPLHDLHLASGARMVPFAGYNMPVQFEGVKAEHLHTRQAAGLFDVSHMGQILVEGAKAAEKLEQLIPVDLVDLPVNKQRYALLTNNDGGILDDLMICRWDTEVFFLVVNAACKQEDFNWLQSNLEDLEITAMEDKALLALQGPDTADVMAEYLPDTENLAFMQGCHGTLEGSECFVTRSGYTGEDGFEISLPASLATAFAKKLLEHTNIKPVGLGARDTLRLEAGLCLYGHDMNIETTPVAANLAWSISKARRSGGDREGGFPGADIILQQLAQGTDKKRVGLKVEGKAPVREGAELVDTQDQPVGIVTSGGFGPSMNAPIAMGYVQTDLSDTCTSLSAMVRGKPLPVTVTSVPFIKPNYKR